MSNQRQQKGKPRKHPLAPKKPRSAFILFSQHMHHVNKKDACFSESNEKVIILYAVKRWHYFSHSIHSPLFLTYKNVRCLPPLGATSSPKTFSDLEEYDNRRAK
jgi:hypothetical protein